MGNRFSASGTADDHAVIVDSCDFAVRAVGTVLS